MENKRHEVQRNMMNRLKNLFILAAVLVLLNGCASFHLRQDNNFSGDSCLITGHILSTEPVKHPVIVAAYSGEGDKGKIVHYTVLHKIGFYQLLVPQGRYRIYAFEDANGNLIVDPDELAGTFVNGGIDAPAGRMVHNIAVILARNTYMPVPPDALAKHAAGNFNRHSTQAGAIINLDAPPFSAEQGERGFRSPFEFFREWGGNIYFLEPYDSKRIPILLVHGAAGSPQDWRYFIKNIDRSRYQIWIWYYPSGARLKTMADLMSAKIEELHNRYEFKKMHITAHGMGGPVVRNALVNWSSFYKHTELFISVSAPFRGGEAAATAAKQSPVVIPGQKDMEPDSRFIKDSFAGKMPPAVKSYLFLGRKGGGNQLRTEGGTESAIAGMTDPRAQAEALKVFDFNEDYVGILNSPEVFAQYKAILDSTDKENASVVPKEKIIFRYNVTQMSDVPPMWMLLCFLPKEDKMAGYTMQLDPLMRVQMVGPVAKGSYDVGLLAWGYRVNPYKVNVEVSGEKVAEVGFSLEAQGMVGGQVLMNPKQDDAYWGFLPNETEKVTSVTLSGENFRRKITPKENIRQVIKAVISNEDYFYDGWFVFFDVPKGNCKVTVEADGVPPVEQSVAVDPRSVSYPLKINVPPEQ